MRKMAASSWTSRSPLYDAWRSLPSCVQALNSISAISVGCDQTTFLRRPSYLDRGSFLGELVEKAAKLVGVSLFESRPNRPDVDEILPSRRGKQKAPDPCPRRRRLLVADDHEARRLDALDLVPVAKTARPVGAVPVLGDDALETMFAGGFEDGVAVAFYLLREMDRLRGVFQQAFQQVSTASCGTSTGCLGSGRGD